MGQQRERKKTAHPVFDYRALRLVVGLIALSLPYVVIAIADDPLPSISASYHSSARDALVGMLFIVGAFLWAYNGHYWHQASASKVAAVAAVVVAVVPTSRPGSPDDLSAHIHLGASAVLFLILAYFCLWPFRENTKGQGGCKGRRSFIYLLCGVIMLAALGGATVAKQVIADARADELRVVYWAELIALNAFGIAWITAGKVIPGLVDKGDNLFVRKPVELEDAIET